MVLAGAFCLGARTLALRQPRETSAAADPGALQEDYVAQPLLHGLVQSARHEPQAVLLAVDLQLSGGVGAAPCDVAQLRQEARRELTPGQLRFAVSQLHQGVGTPGGGCDRPEADEEEDDETSGKPGTHRSASSPMSSFHSSG